MAGNDMSTKYNRVVGYPVIFEIVSFDASTATTAALTPEAAYLFQATKDCHIVFAASPTATTAATRLWEGVPYMFTMPAGSALKVAAIKNATAGLLYISTMTPDRI